MDQTQRGAADFENLLSPAIVARMTNGTVSEDFIREACWRDAQHHPLPCLKAGAKRRMVKIRWSDFTRWLQEEIHGVSAQ